MNIGKHARDLSNEMKLKNYSYRSINMYEDVITKFLRDFEVAYTKPSEIPTEDIKQWLLQSPSISTFRIRLGALKVFYSKVVKQPLKFKYIEYPKPEKKHHVLLSTDEMIRLFKACSNKKHYCIMLVAYATGVRVSELLNIKLTDIDRANGVIHILNGKGGKSRQVTMKPELLEVIEGYYSEFEPKKYLFEGTSIDGKYTPSSINQFLKKYASEAGIKKNIHIHLLRHQYATDCLDNGENLYITQKALGHASPKTTADFYYHLTSKTISQAYSPIQNIKNDTQTNP